MIQMLQSAIIDIIAPAPEISWSICIRQGDGQVLAAHRPDAQLATASLGKLLLLIEAAREFESDPSLPDRWLRRDSAPAVAEAGLWQHLRVPSLPMADIAILTASVSDNLATNVLLEQIGLEQVKALGESLALTQTALLDRVRRERTAEDPPHLSVGTGAEFSQLMGQLHRGEMISATVAREVRHWLSLNADLSMVAASFGLDPLAHANAECRLVLHNKTGCDRGVRGEAGILQSGQQAVTYAVLANWPGSSSSRTNFALTAMRHIGKAMREQLERAGI
jgi:beta-lactamase class A